MQELIKVFEEQKIISIIRASDHGDAESIAKAVSSGGIKILEITPNVSQWTKLIETLSKQNGLTVGFGSATDGEQAYRAINAGARFVSSLYLDKNILTVCKNNNVLVVQGASTITEAIEAHNFGVDLIKIFPANFLGKAAYLKCLRKSFPFLKLMPSGGVNLDNVMDYIKGGVTACSVGRGLCDTSMIRTHQWSQITERAKQFTQKLETLKVVR
jgi:2-dehydro-3-deoxyphosphogluconate aldolase / (4S)-4-hydroxy-2-oxoglutarate aldolase